MRREPPRTTRRAAASVLLAVGALAAAMIVAVLVGRLAATSSSSASMVDSAGPAGPADPAPAEHALGDDGGVADGTTVFDEVGAVTNLDPDLLDAIRRAATDAAAEGIVFEVNDGWRSPEYQERLLREAVAQYGSEAEAARWVATPETSPHVRGEAVDIGEWDAAAWLDEHGAAYGVCRIYDNEPWHFELRAEAVDSGCPDLYFDPTYDPRMQG
ncbi:M15 family metallopeptidase [Agromyces sp. NPDC058110]|uniref:M15 family metallopeptidase n=1 Tax=Agromyces sp. NPDC058110 TaxID=3346345 RepID=UPI0036DC4FCB